MAYLIYRAHTIVSSASQDENHSTMTSGHFNFLDERNGRRDVHFLRNSRALCESFREAENFGLERAKDWIDYKVLGDKTEPGKLVCFSQRRMY
jgi:hypothetical protein